MMTLITGIKNWRRHYRTWPGISLTRSAMSTTTIHGAPPDGSILKIKKNHPALPFPRKGPQASHFRWWSYSCFVCVPGDPQSESMNGMGNSIRVP